MRPNSAFLKKFTKKGGRPFLEAVPEAIVSPRTGATARSQGRQPLEPVRPSDFPRRPPQPRAMPGVGEAAWGNGSGRDRRPGADAPGYVLPPRRGFWDRLLMIA